MAYKIFKIAESDSGKLHIIDPLQTIGIWTFCGKSAKEWPMRIYFNPGQGCQKCKKSADKRGA